MINVEAIKNPHLRKVLVDYCGNLLKLFDNNIKSIALYGSAITDEFIPKRSNINLLVIFKTLEFDELYKMRKLVRGGLRSHKIRPLMVSIDHILTSRDIFPIEFLEMKENNLLLWGEDILGALEISNQELRLECEQAIKGRLIRVRQAYLENSKALSTIMIDSLLSLIPAMRNMLRLKTSLTPTLKKETIEALGREFAIDSKPLLKILELKEGQLKLKVKELQKLFADYLSTLQHLAELIDKVKT